MKYGVFDRTGHLVRAFNTFEGAETFKAYSGRRDWKVKQLN